MAEPPNRCAIEESQDSSRCSSVNGIGPPRQSQDSCLEKSTGTGTALVLRLESHNVEEDEREKVDGYVVVAKPENEVEAHRISNNYMFGMIKWKSHVTQRPLSERSDVIKKLYDDPKQVKFITESTISFGNILYCLLFGWWLALVYLIVAFFMVLTVVGLPYAKFCWMLAEYFFWPFGKFVREHATYSSIESVKYKDDLNEDSLTISPDESTPLVNNGLATSRYSMKKDDSNYWKQPLTYVWLVLGVPILFIVHSVVALTAWLLVFFIPVAKVNTTAIKKILFMPPKKIRIDSLDMVNSVVEGTQYEVVLCTYEAVNIYYYKYTVDGINVIMFNLSIFVIITLLLGYIDSSNQVANSLTKFGFSLMSIIPLAYYIGMAITSISAQSNFAVGAVLNATFGSIVEITLYVSAFLSSAGKETQSCYPLLVKSALTGTLLVTMLLIPGLCMLIGGIKYREQNFNSKSVGVSSSLLFVSVAGAFAPTIFAKIYGNLICNCYTTEVNFTVTNITQKLWICENCSNILTDVSQDIFYQDKILPLIYICVSLLPLAYIAGLLFTLKTHTYIYSSDLTASIASNSDSTSSRPEHHHSIAHWGRIKGVAVLLVSTVIMCLCAELVTSNIQPVLEESALITEIFIGGLLLAIVPNIPEILNGIQFALHNNISLSIEVGCGVAVQVCLLQIPILVIFNAFYDIGFVLIFTDLHLYSVLFGVLLMNYIFQDGKCDYFQGTALLAVYLIFMAMYFFAPANKTQCI